MYSSTHPEGAAPPATERLYYTDAYRRTFLAGILAVVPAGDGRAGVILDRTAFYPTSGGQPHDTGTLAGVAVVDVVDAGEHVVHVLEAGAPPPGIGTEVEGAIDWTRRYDHMQQHTAQHLVSAACLTARGAETVSVHLGDTSTIDLDCAALDAAGARAVDDAVADAVYENRPVTVRFVEAADVEALGLRRPPKRAGTLRIVEIEGTDRSACGGTHVRATGELGPVLLRRWERTKGRIRVEFFAGRRALADYRWKHALVAEWAGRLTVGTGSCRMRWGAWPRAARSVSALHTAAGRRLVAYEAAERLAAAPAGRAFKVLRLEFPQRDQDEVRLLLRELTGRERCVVLAGIVEAGRLLFARSPDVAADMAALLKQAAQAVGGRGGGTAEMAQGTAPPAAVTQALTFADAQVRSA